TFRASAAPRWKRQISTLPRALPRPAAPFTRSCANTTRRRNVGFRPIVTSASAPLFMKTRLSTLPPLKIGRRKQGAHRGIRRRGPNAGYSSRRERQREVHAVQHRARVHPLVRRVRPPVGRLAPEDRLTQAH